MRRDGWAAGVVPLCCVQFVDVLGVTVVITALPTMLADLHAPSSATGLVVTGYAMFFGGLLVLGARAGDRYGHRRVLQCGIGGFGAASLLAAFAPTVAVLVAARCLQGAAAAMSVPAALRLLSVVTDDEPGRRRALAVWSASGAAAGASGFVIGGLVTQFVTWRAIFWINVVLAVVLAVAVRHAVPADRGDARSRLDVAGAALLTGVVMALVVGAALLEQSGTRWVGVGLIVLGAVAVPALVAVEKRRPAPLLPGAAVGHRGLRSGSTGAFLNTATTSSAMTLATVHLQQGRNLGPGEAGLLLLPFSLSVIAGSALAARAVLHLSLRNVAAVGLAMIAVGDLALFAVQGAVVAVPFCVALAGLGIGLSSVAATTLGTDVPDVLQGVASGIVNTTAQLGTALGVAVILLVAGVVGGADGPVGGAGAGWVCAGVLALAGAVVLVRSAPDRESVR